MKTPILKTKRLTLRPISLDDAPAVQKYFNDWDIIKYMSKAVPWPYPNDGAYTYINEEVIPRMEKQIWFVWAITLSGTTNACIGLINFRIDDIVEGNRGFWIAKQYQQNGYITEAVYAVNDFAFNTLQIESFEAHNAISNVASNKVKKRTGAKLIRTERQEYHNGDKIGEVWEITKEKWEGAKKKLSF